LAACLIEGNGVRQDILKGIKLMNMALDQDNPVALYMAGLYLMDGDIVEQAVDLAHEFFVKSSKQGLWLADEVLEDWDECFNDF
jgi:TPR repeat protein